MQNNEGVGIIGGRLAAAIELRKTTQAQLMRASGVDKATISLILKGEREGTSALMVAKLATALWVSVDYLVGLSNNPDPQELMLGDVLIELTQVAQKLTSRRQRDLLMSARGYLAAGESLRGNPDLLMNDMLDLIEEAGGKSSRDELLERLAGSGFFDGLTGGDSLTDEDSEEPFDGDS
jgi:transcriptional regulator with XRE-family HTH domain